MSTNLSDVVIYREKTRSFDMKHMKGFLQTLYDRKMCFLDNHDIGYEVNPQNIKFETIEYVFGRSDIKCTFTARKFATINGKGTYLDETSITFVTIIFVA